MDSRAETFGNPFQTPPPPSRPSRLQNPEDYYRPNSPDSHGYAHTAHSPSSPTDSQAPIMYRSSPVGSFPPRPDTATPTQHGSHPSQDQVFYPPPTIPEAINYRTSMGVINGEVDGSRPAALESPTHGAIPPLSAQLPKSAGFGGTSGIPRTPGTTKEAERVEALELKARKFDRKDLAIKLKIRLGKIVLRSVNCACSLVVLALVASTFAIFYSTRNLAPRQLSPTEKFKPWATNTPQWPQIVTLVVACISLCLSLFIMYSYWRGGHHMAERAALRVTVIAGAIFLATVIMWASIIGIMQSVRSGSGGEDIWGWACNDNQRRKLFQDSINYVLVCRQQDWVVVCAIIEISVEFLAILLYLFAFWRIFYSKKRLRKSMNVRDDARSALWLAQLKEEQQNGDLEAQNDETSKNTAYNTLNMNSKAKDVPEKNEVPILQAVPRAARRNGSVGGAEWVPPVPPPPVLPAALAEMQGQRSPRVVSFAQFPEMGGGKPPGTSHSA